MITRSQGKSDLKINDPASVRYRVRPVRPTGSEPATGLSSPAAEEAGARPATGPAAVAVEGAAQKTPSSAVATGEAEAPGRVRPTLPEATAPRVSSIRPGALDADSAGVRPTGIRPRRAGGIRRLALGAAEAAFTIVMLLVDVIWQLIVIPYLERIQRKLEDRYRAGLQDEIQRYYDTHFAGWVENRVLAQAESIREIEDMDAQPYVNTTVTVHFKRSWNLLTGRSSGPPESVLDLSFDSLNVDGMRISDSPVEEASGPLVAEDELPLFEDTFSTEFRQTVQFPVIPPPIRINRYGSNPSAKAAACFIATACYGTADAPQVATLRRFRDAHLMPRPTWRRFVRWYYRTSPPIADGLRRRPVARWAVRTFFVAPLAATIRVCRLDRPREAPPAEGSVTAG
ncbi:CFI-box-CTERM domain-containing protein [Streptomyces galilaeus]